MRLVDHHYDMNWVNTVFCIGAVILLGTWGWAIWDDYAKPYKDYQRKFYEVYTEQLELEKRGVFTEDKQRELNQKKQELQQTQATLEQRGGEVDQLKKEIKRLNEIRIPAQDKKAKQLSAELTPVEYKYEQEKARAESHEDYEVPAELERRYQRLTKRYREEQRKMDELTELLEQKEQTLEQKREQVNKLEREIQNLTQERNVLRDTINRISDRPINRILDAPMINFISPRVKIQQFQVGGIYQDYNFDLVPRRDYCMSCHMGINNPAFEVDEDGDFENETIAEAFETVFQNETYRKRLKRVFKAHPNRELIGPNSAKFPFSKYGCTGCHLGDGRALEFTRAAHTPDNEKERKRWKKQYDWHPRHYWEQPMLKSQHYEAGMRKFYPRGKFVNIPDAPELNEGRKLWRKYGCANCHLIDGMEDQRKIGFSLEHVSSKLSKDWVRRWVEKPADFSSNTRMPQVFHKINMSSTADRERSTVVIDAITEYLFEKSRPVDLEPAPRVRGDIAEGKRLVERVGCFGCHSMEREGFTSNTSAPDLSYVGSKIESRRWLFKWLKDPESIWPGTHMPSMKLTDQEANDITEYLLSLEKEGWSPEQFPNELNTDDPLEEVVDERLEELTMNFLERTRGPRAAQAKFEEIKNGEAPGNATGEQAVKLYLGQQAVDYWGCSSCHMIPGHEGPNRIGPELTEEANKSLHKFSFNYVHIPHTRQNFIDHKIKNPGVFDQGMAKSYLEKLRMPQPNMPEEEREDVTTHVMSQTSDRYVDEDFRLDPGPAQDFVVKGRKLVAEYNCQGCHTLDSESSITEYLRTYYQEQKQAGNDVPLGSNDNPSVTSLVQAHVPPTLTNVGLRLDQEWLFDFLKEPDGPENRDKIRTWQHIRMPDFQFTDEEASSIAQGFVYEGWGHQPDLISNEGRSTTPEKRRVGEALYDRVCSNCHIAQGTSEYKEPQMTPNLSYIGDKFHYEGFLDWIEEPSDRFVPEDANVYRHQGMIPYPEMPINESTVGFEPEGDYSTKEKQLEAIRDYLFYQQYNLSFSQNPEEE